MNVHFPERRTWPGRLVNLAVAVVVLALAAATFVLSYPGVHTIVAQAGVSARLARIYPGLFDALFVVACVAAVVLRDARWWARLYAWLVVIAVVAVVGAADAVHAMNVTLPHRTIEGVVAAAPWVIVLLGFGLMLTMLRQARAQHAAGKAPSAEPAGLPRPPEAAPARTAPALPQAAPVPSTASLPESLLVPETPAAADAGAWTAATEAETAEPDAGAVEPDARAAEPDAEAGTESGEPGEAVEPSEAAEAIDPGEPAEVVEPVEAAVPAPDAEPRGQQGQAHPGERETAGEPAAAPGRKGVLAYAYGDSGRTAWSAGESHPPTLPSPVVGDEAPPRPAAPVTVRGAVIDDDDAPPFATAPFATVPRLNRVRSTPTPPEVGDEDE